MRTVRLSRSVYMLSRCGVAALVLSVATSRAAHRDDAQTILRETNIRGGLIVHVGCGDGKLTAELGAAEGYVVHGLDADAKQVDAAREHIGKTGRYGTISVDRFDGVHLPYAENLVNLLIADDLGDVSHDEVMRVLCPRGVAYVKYGASWKKTVKPWPGMIDEWPHYLHGPDNNAVAQDAVVGPPQQTQWVGGPAFARSHEINSSMAAMVSAGGRLFYIWDEGPTALTDHRLPAKWSLIARDAFNGTTLWKRAMPQWGWRQWHAASRWDDPRERAKMLRHLPSTLPRRLVAAGDRLYVTLGYQAPVSVLDAATGEVLREFEHTALTEEILHTENTLVLRMRVAESPPEKDVWDEVPLQQKGRIMAVDARTGRTLWQSVPEPIAPLTVATRKGRIYYSNYERVVCLDLASGQQLWRSPEVAGKLGHRGTVGTLVAQDNVVLYALATATGKQFQLHAFSAETGELLWNEPTYAGPGVTNPPDLFVVDDLVWIGETSLPVDNMRTELSRQGLDPASGDVKREITVPKLISPGHHYRCYRSKATERYLLLPKRGVEFVDLQKQDHMRNDWLRAPCIYGMLPANGMLYVAPHQCVCYPGVQLANFNALAPAATGESVGESIEPVRLEKGSAYGTIRGADRATLLQAEDWPVYRHDARRSGSVPTSVPERLEEKWRCPVGKNLTPPVVAARRLLVADKDTHTVHALDADDGKRLWSYTAGGRVDSPPTIYGSLVLFGSSDGRVVCLRLSDGREVWRFLAAPRDRRITACGQVESVWPVHGSVLVEVDATLDPPQAVVYFTAGRSSFLDGGIHVYGLDPHSGKILHDTRLSGPRPDPFQDVGTAGYMDGSKSDLLVSDGADLYLYQERFRSDLKRFPAPMQQMAKENGGFRIYPPFPERGSSGKRLIATSGFLDDSYNEGTYWTFSERWPGWDRKMRKVPSFGQLLVFDDHSAYGVHVFTDNIRVRRGMTLGGKGYRLFARDHEAQEDRWSLFVPVRIRALVSASDKLFFAGPPDTVPVEDPLAAIEGRQGAILGCVSHSNGQQAAEVTLDSPPVFDGMIAADGRLFLSTCDGNVVCMGKTSAPE